MKAQEIRDIFINFFKERNHTVVPSANLVPTHDPTLLFTSAGMVQFKKLWSGEIELPYSRAVSIQKCLRASDLEKVGKSAKYNTFFEMCGNFSFGDYFKHKAIEWAWEFVTKIIKLPQKKLSVSVLDEDEEAYNIWKKEIRLPDSKIYKLGKEDNFWAPAGGRGACGPCSEIYYDLGEKVGCGRPNCEPGCECDRFIEVWNLVFPQYDSQPNGTLKSLKNKGVDTGLGFERFFMVIENKKSLFELPLFQPIIEETQQIFGIKYEQNKVTFNIIADHIRALTFAISEGIYPSNIGRGYLLRHLLRRAQSAAYEVGIKKPFLYRLVGVVADIMKDQYPELVDRREGVALVVKAEEESFLRTLYKGIKVFNDTVAKLKSNLLSGEIVFKLYDTYGFPPDLTYEMAKRKGLKSDKKGFNEIMESYKKQAREFSKFKVKEVEWKEISKYKGTEFLGYDKLKIKAHILRWRKINDKFEFVLDRTPFYAESGGQVGDRGKIYNEKLEFQIIDTQNRDGLWVHIGKKGRGEIEGPISEIICEVDEARRKAIERNHTGTHLLHAGLRKVIGNWVHQEGSLVEKERFRFDFTHFKPLEQYEIEKVEDLINLWILENIKVETRITSFEEAVKEGAMAIFGEKYGEKVRSVRIGDISFELCGGTHVKSTGEIGVLKIVGETGVHAGIRRVEVITGTYAMERIRKIEKELLEVSTKLRIPMFEVKERVNELLKNETNLKNKLFQLECNELIKLVPEILSKKEVVKGINIFTANVSATNIEGLRILADKLREGSKRAGVIGAHLNNKPVFITFVSSDLKTTLKASEIAKQLGKLVGGGGGGKDTIGQAGGKKAIKINSILNKVKEIIEKLI